MRKWENTTRMNFGIVFIFFKKEEVLSIVMERAFIFLVRI